MHLGSREFVSALGLLTLAPLALGNGNGFVNLGTNLTAYAVSENGDVVAGYDATQYFLWTTSSGVQAIGGTSPQSGSAGGKPSLSFDGTRLSGTVLNTALNQQQIGLYDVVTGTWLPLGGLGAVIDGSASSGWGISGDGSTLVGLGWIPGAQAHAITWRQDTGIVDLGTTVPNRSTRANAADLDGDTVVGWQDNTTGFRQAAVWVNGVQTLIDIAGSPLSEAGAVSADGTWVVGNGSGSNGFQPWRWSATTGAQSLGHLNPAWRGAATAISADGSVIVGYDRPFPGPATFGRGFVWTEATGMLDLTDLAIAQGIDLGGAVLALPLAISADGRTIVGSARGANIFGFRLTLPEEPYGYTAYGTGLSATNDMVLGGVGTPVLGGSLVLATTNATPGAVLLAASLGSAQLPLFGGVALIDPLSLIGSFAVATVGGTATFSGPIPSIPSLAGVPFYFQSFGPDPTKAEGLALSNGLSAVIRR